MSVQDNGWELLSALISQQTLALRITIIDNLKMIHLQMLSFCCAVPRGSSLSLINVMMRTSRMHACMHRWGFKFVHASAALARACLAKAIMHRHTNHHGRPHVCRYGCAGVNADVHACRQPRRTGESTPLGVHATDLVKQQTRHRPLPILCGACKSWAKQQACTE